MNPSTALLDLYDRALPDVYGYLSRRCDSVSIAEDLTADTFLAALVALQNDRHLDLSVGWLIGTARHKLVDHWRRNGRQRDALAELWDDLIVPDHSSDPIEVEIAQETLQALAPLHRAVLTLRYLDGLPVGEVAAVLDRSVHATESLLTRAKTAFRRSHQTEREVR